MIINVNKINECLDYYLVKNKKTFISAPEANKILEEAGLIKDNKRNPGKPLRKLLRAGYFPHAYQKSGKSSRWIIPKSKSEEVILYCKDKKDKAGENNLNNNLQQNISELREKLNNSRLNYKPDIIKYLLIAQAPPDSIERFFYYTNVPKHDYLFLGITGVLYPKLKREFLISRRNADLKNSILLKFKEEGFYLIDLSELPITYLTTNLEEQLPKLAEKIKELVHDDTKIILIKSDVYKLAFSYLNNSFKNGIDVKNPFPSNGHYKDFGLMFSKALDIAGYCIEDN